MTGRRMAWRLLVAPEALFSVPPGFPLAGRARGPHARSAVAVLASDAAAPSVWRPQAGRLTAVEPRLLQGAADLAQRATLSAPGQGRLERPVAGWVTREDPASMALRASAVVLRCWADLLASSEALRHRQPGL